MVAIDAGKSGGFAWDIGGKVEAQKMPATETEVVQLFSDLREMALNLDEKIPEVVIEKVGGYVGTPQTGASMFNFGKGYGVLIGAAIAFEMPLSLVRPQEWQKGMGVGPKGERTTTEWKRYLKETAQRLFPDIPVTLSTSDALLLLVHARRTS